ncbi:hypothetical protein LCGC14_0734070 [marine sediment metagenome]|uniref:Uncharacterized protein n=1 Tax=marine sediment metagenome TaxID=412755 RepID=A0A0F9Q8S3_9ZZZZ
MRTITSTVAVVDDQRTEADKAATVCFVVATDGFMSGWGQAPGRSIFAVPCRSWEESSTVTDNMNHRSEMKRVRLVGLDWRPRLLKGDHLSIRAMDDCERFYTPGGFACDH